LGFDSGGEMIRATERRWWVWALGGAVVASVAFGGYAAFAKVAPQPAGASGRTNPPSMAIPVVAAHARVGDMNVYLTGLGTVTALKTVTVRTQVDGQLVTVAFKEGQLVRATELLAQIDPRPFQVQLEQAEGQAARDAATLKNARVDLQRYQVLAEQEAVPRQQLDTQVATVQQLEATLKSDQAQIDSARLNLTYARITSPLTGRIGLRLVDPGNIVHTTDQNGLAVITQRQPIAVVFTIPQDNLPDVQRQLNAGRRLTVDAYDRDLRTKLGSGTLSAIDSQIDPTTGTIKLKATFGNDSEALFPNQFVNARLLVNTIQHAIIVPSPAIQRGPQTTFVYVVTPNNTVESRDVALSMTEDDESVVASGLAAGELVVTDGVDRLQPGATVSIRFADPKAQRGSQ
jgi:membrane fusion protein, multidrug efflux system